MTNIMQSPDGHSQLRDHHRDEKWRKDVPSYVGS